MFFVTNRAVGALAALLIAAAGAVALGTPSASECPIEPRVAAAGPAADDAADRLVAQLDRR